MFEGDPDEAVRFLNFNNLFYVKLIFYKLKFM